jgi:predicted amidohydrolase YtcJ
MMSKRYSRRGFLNFAGGGAGLLGASSWTKAWAAETPDLIVTTATVYTVDSAMPKAEAFAVRDGKFVAVGKSDEIRGLAGKGTQMFDAKGMTIVPGFIDCHNHAPGNVLLYEVVVGNPYVVEFVTIQSIIDKLKARAAKTPANGWVEGYFFDDTKVKDNREINVHDLDKVSTTQPVAVHHRGGHTSYYNSKALEMAGVTKNTPNSFGGTYDKDPNGELNGRVTDRARGVFAKVGTRATFTPAEQLQRDREGLAFISKQFVKYGLTTVHHEGGDLMALQQVRARGDLLHRVSYECQDKVLDAMIAAGMESGLGDEWIRFGATSEHTVDGSFSERTMAISKPYIGISPPYQGNLTEKQEDLDAWADKVNRAGIQMNCHANGDVAIDHVLTAYERALKAFPRADARPKITHCSLINDSILARIKAMNAVPALFTTYAYYNSDKFHFYGEDMMKHMMAYRTLLDAGVRAAAGSDFSPGPFDPLMGMQGMVTRKGWNGETWGVNQKITVEEALRVNTINGAYNNHEENIKGSITAGKLADYVVLAEDLHTIDPEKIKDIKIVRTVTGGKTVYQA